MNAPVHPSETSAGPHRAGAAFATAGLLGVLREAPMVAAGVLLFAGFAATSSVFPTAANAENKTAAGVATGGRSFASS